MRWGVIAAAVMAGAAGVATAQPPAETPPDWLRKPTMSEMMSVWPPKADKSGSASISCVVTVKGALRDCSVVTESPVGMGYGASALLLAPSFLMRPATAQGAPVESSVTIPINFVCPEGCIFSMYGLRRVRRSSNWAEAPSIDDVIAAYPRKAAAENVGADFAISCAVIDKGRLNRCRIISRNPPNKGFERSVTALADKFRGPDGIKPGSGNDPVATRLRFTFDPAILNGDREVEPATWVDQPSDQTIGEAFPAIARQHGIAGGRAVIRCAVRPAGVLADCMVREETPAAEGFGEAARTLVEKGRVATWTEDGRPVIGGFVSYAVEFKPGPPPAP